MQVDIVERVSARELVQSLERDSAMELEHFFAVKFPCRVSKIAGRRMTWKRWSVILHAFINIHKKHEWHGIDFTCGWVRRCEAT